MICIDFHGMLLDSREGKGGRGQGKRENQVRDERNKIKQKATVTVHIMLDSREGKGGRGQGKRENRMRDEREKNKIESYSNRVNMHGYCSNIVYVQYYRWTDVGKF